MTTQDLYNVNMKLLGDLGIQFKECTSEPVLNYETAEKVMKQFGLTGTESKSLFLKAKNGKYYMLITVRGQKADFDKLKEIIGVKVSVASQEELKQQTGCEPYCAIPFGYSKEIGIIVDPQIYKPQKYIYSPGPTEKTVEIETKDIPVILNSLPNEKIKL